MTPPDTLAKPSSQNGSPPSAPGSAQSPVPPPAKLRRRPILLAISVLFVVIGALIAAWLVTTIGNTSAVIGIRQDVPRGSVIQRDDLMVVDITPDPSLKTVAAGQLSAEVGKHATQDLSAGSVLTPAQVTDQTLPATGDSLVGVSLSPAQLPSQPLQPGDNVRLVVTPRQQDDPPDQAPRAVSATVVSSSHIGDQGQVVVNVTVPQTSAAQLAAAAATGRLALVLDSST